MTRNRWYMYLVSPFTFFVCGTGLHCWRPGGRGWSERTVYGRVYIDSRLYVPFVSYHWYRAATVWLLASFQVSSFQSSILNRFERGSFVISQSQTPRLPDSQTPQSRFEGRRIRAIFVEACRAFPGPFIFRVPIEVVAIARSSALWPGDVHVHVLTPDN